MTDVRLWHYFECLHFHIHICFSHMYNANAIQIFSSNYVMEESYSIFSMQFYGWNGYRCNLHQLSRVILCDTLLQITISHSDKTAENTPKMQDNFTYSYIPQCYVMFNFSYDVKNFLICVFSYDHAQQLYGPTLSLDIVN